MCRRIGSINAADMPAEEFEKAIMERMRDANLVSDGPVTVTFVERMQAVKSGDADGMGFRNFAGIGPLDQQNSSASEAGRKEASEARTGKDYALGSKEIAAMTDVQVGMADPQMRKLLDKRDALETRVKQLREKGYGSQHPEMVQANEELYDMKAKIHDQAQNWRDDQSKRAEAREQALGSKDAAGAGREGLTPALSGQMVSGVQLDLVSLANSTVEAAGAVRVAKAEVALKRKLKESGAANDLEREEASLETAVKRLELLRGIAAIALEGATDELEVSRKRYEQGVQSAREVSDAQTRVKMLQLIVKSGG